MNRALKNLLLWLLISLLPIQGMAAVISASCALAATAESSQHAEHHAAPSHCPSDNIEDTSDAATAHHAACSACAACCVGASAPPSMLAPAASHAMSESCFTALGILGGDFIPAGLERPPRFS
jgi:hypothetical protein